MPKSPNLRKPLDKKTDKATKLFDQFVENIKDKKEFIKDAAQDARNTLKSIRNSEKQASERLTKIKDGTDKTLASTEKEVRATAEKVKGNIKELFDEVDGIRNETKTSYGRFKRTYDAALSGERGIVARKADILLIHDKAKVAHKEIDEIKNEALERSSAIKLAHTESLDDQKVVADIKERASEIKTEIENTYHITIDSAMGGSLNTRKGEIKTTMYFWMSALIFGVGALVTAVAYLIVHPPTGGFVDALGNRLVYLTPLLLVIFMIYRQYSHERRLLEEYAFKAAMAQTLRNYAVLLSDNYYPLHA